MLHAERDQRIEVDSKTIKGVCNSIGARRQTQVPAKRRGLTYTGKQDDRDIYLINEVRN